MPSKNTLKEYVAESHYHVYARGASKNKIFIEAADYNYFLNLFARHLSKKNVVSKMGHPYPHFRATIKLEAYCLMSNHFHLLVYQVDSESIQKLMRSIMTSYSRYFNLKYKHTGSLFESRYKAVRIDSDQYLEHISRYIHLNPRRWEQYRYSSLKFYRNANEPEWLHSKKVLAIFPSREAYIQFVEDYEESRDVLAEIKYQLADH
jgi:putative transposase